jgi:virginiamycin B lyase
MLTGSGWTWTLGGCLLLSVCALSSAQSVSFTEYSLGSLPDPIAIASGPDGALWFTDWAGNIGRITTAGAISSYPIPTSISEPFGIAPGPDGALWFTESNGNKIGRITTAGAITEYLIPTSLATAEDITVGPDSALWFTETGANKIGRITTAGAISEYPIPTFGSEPLRITLGPDGALWFTEGQGNKIGRITTVGAISEYPVPTSSSEPFGIVTGPDGALWFTEIDAAQIGRITTSGAISEYPTPTLASGPAYITSGPDGALWFTEFNPNQIGRITTAGVFSEYPFGFPMDADYPYGITTGPDGALWFAESGSQRIGRAVISSPLLTTVTSVTSSTPDGTYAAGASISIQVTFSGPVTVTGTPQLALNAGGAANYISGSGSTTLTFLYAVGNCVSSAHLNYTSTADLTLNGGSIRDALLNNASLALPPPAAPGSLGANQNIVVGVTGSALFFTGAVSLGGGVCYLQIPGANFFGYYNLQSFPWLYHYDMGFEYFIDANDGGGGAYLYDATSGHWFFTGSSIFPYLYDFTLAAWIYYVPDPLNPGHYTTNPRKFAYTSNHQIFTM